MAFKIKIALNKYNFLDKYQTTYIRIFDISIKFHRSISPKNNINHKKNQGETMKHLSSLLLSALFIFTTFSFAQEECIEDCPQIDIIDDFNFVAEDYEDLNGNGIYDEGEPFEDENENGVWDDVSGTIIDWCTILLSWNENECLSDCEGEVLEEITDIVTQCADCINDDSIDCEDIFDDNDDDDNPCTPLGEEYCETGNFLDADSCNAEDNCAWEEEEASCHYVPLDDEWCCDEVECDDEDCELDEDCEDGEWCEDGECVGDDGPPECIYDCPDFDLVDGDTDLNSTEACTIISSWGSDPCIDDCTDEEFEGINMFITMCTECLYNENCDEMFDEDCESDEDCEDGEWCEDGDCVVDCDAGDSEDFACEAIPGCVWIPEYDGAPGHLGDCVAEDDDGCDPVDGDYGTYYPCISTPEECENYADNLGYDWDGIFCDADDFGISPVWYEVGGGDVFEWQDDDNQVCDDSDDDCDGFATQEDCEDNGCIWEEDSNICHEDDAEGPPECALDCGGCIDYECDGDLEFCAWLVTLPGDECLSDCDEDTLEELADFVIVNNEQQLLLPQLIKVLKDIE